MSVETYQSVVRWFIEFDARGWDEQIEADLEAGRLDGLIAEAMDDYRAGNRSIMVCARRGTLPGSRHRC
jgi:hypothetical protein